MNADSGHLVFRFDWESPNESVRSDEIRSTYARLEIWVNDECLTLVEDKASGSSRRAVYVSLYPLAEWISFNWFLIATNGRPSWQRGLESRENALTTSTQQVGDGFAWPDIRFVAEHHRVRVRWLPAHGRSAMYPVRFIGSGEAVLPLTSLQESLAELVRAVLERLRDQGVSGTPLEKEWKALNDLDSDEIEFCRAAGRLGLDPFSEGIELADALTRVFDAVDPNIRDEFLDAVDPTGLDSAIDWLSDAHELVAAAPTASPRLNYEDLGLVARRGVGRSSFDLPWAIGYDLARRVRDSLGLTSNARLDIEPDVNLLNAPVVDPALVAFGRSRGVPSVVLGHFGRETTNRFVGARSIFSALLHPDRDFLLTGSHSPEQQASRAFAAELLAPADGIRELLGLRFLNTSDEAMLSAAEHFGVSGLVIQHQIENQLLAI